MLVDKEGLWYRVLKARYGEEGGRHGSLWWRMLCNIRRGVGMGVASWFEDYTHRVVGDVRNTYFWTDNWVVRIPLRIKFCRLFDLVVHCECSVEEMTSLGGRRECVGVEETTLSVGGG